MGPEKQSIGLREIIVRATSLAALAFASVTNSGCVEPTISPNPTDPNKPTPTEFVPSATNTATIEPTGTSSPTPTEIPMPESLANILPGYSINQGHLVDASGVSLGDVVKDQADGSTDLSFTTTDFNDQAQEHFIDLSTVSVRPSGAIIIDSDKRTGFVWKGDKWAEILLQIQFETDGTRFDRFPTITYEDIASGALAEAECLAAEPLPDKVVPLTDYYIYSNKNFNFVIIPSPSNGQLTTYYNDNSTKPMRYGFFYNLEINGIQTVVSTLQIKIPDGSTRFLHIIANKEYLTSENLNSHPKDLEAWTKHFTLEYMPVFDLSIFDGPNFSCNNPPNVNASVLSKQAICPINQPNKDNLETLSKRWIDSGGNIPTEFEREIFEIGSVSKWTKMVD
jgi:hypothetical protein